ncbi:BA14K family protein [Rhizobium sp. CNPSo 3464]|uniref:BA14K family protein n=1 Tax=Rhizobium sp. CNPSo 3464 TaxID=3021406 RepID=UPI00254FFC29|nr:BA14K family protein [Rhizobium sp. CNPSo 3464]MDK4738750.1 BA14K family protein [Rhizobium sp. CNPSo 3464]
MLGFRARIATIVVSAAVALTSFTPSFAMQMPAAPVAAADKAAPADVQQVQWRRYGGYHGGYYPYYRRGWYGGYRGYPGYRYGYRYYDGYWYPLAAFGAGAIIGGAIASQPRYVAPAGGINPRHVEWCEARYRSYRAYDNTFQPNRGPRQQCYSPFY